VAQSFTEDASVSQSSQHYHNPGDRILQSATASSIIKIFHRGYFIFFFILRETEREYCNQPKQPSLAQSFTEDTAICQKAASISKILHRGFCRQPKHPAFVQSFTEDTAVRQSSQH
jgi:hypothetical protein